MEESEPKAEVDVAGEPTDPEDPAGEVAETELTALNPPKPKPSHPNANKETIGDIVFDVVARTTERRSSSSKMNAKVFAQKSATTIRNIQNSTIGKTGINLNQN